MNYADRCKLGGTKLELGVHRARSIWKKKHQGKVYYFSHPLTKEGYQQALHEWHQTLNRLSESRPNADLWKDARETIEQCLEYYKRFGVPPKERRHIGTFREILGYIEETLKSPTLPESLYSDMLSSDARMQFTEGRLIPSAVWRDRLSRLKESGVETKAPQTIEYWLAKYIERTNKRGGKFISEKSAKDRAFKLAHLKRTTDIFAHVSTIDETWLEQYHHTVDSARSEATGELLSKKSKEGYFKAVKMWIRWASTQKNCEMKLPANIDSRESGFREVQGTGRAREEKKRQLWTPEEFNFALQNLPLQYRAYLILMLNCGFRHIDLSELKKTDLRLDEGRIVIQRHKLNQQDTAPVISYKLWTLSIDLIKKTMAKDSEYVFLNAGGAQIERSLKLWWKRHKGDYGNKRLDYLRKTGSTVIARYDARLDEFYLGESLNSTARIHYSFNDGEPNQALDDAIGFLGSEFGLSEAPVKTVQLTDEMRQALLQAGFSV